jgi:hypothetical protein
VGATNAFAPTGRWGMAQEAKSQAREAGFEAAQGFVRDGLASLRNLEHLLKSPKIGPRALERVVAEIHGASQPLGDALVLLIELVRSRSAGLDVTSLLGFTRDSVSFLDDAIAQAAKSDMGAKSRLRLEAQVVRLAADLDALRDLIDLLDAATSAIPNELDLNALAMEALAKRAPATLKQPGIVHVAVTRAKEGSTVVADARVVMPLMAVAFGLVVSQQTKLLQVSATLDGKGEAKVTCGPRANGHAAAVPCVLPRVIVPSLDVVRSAAALTGASLFFEEAEARVSLVIPPGQISQTVVRSSSRLEL